MLLGRVIGEVWTTRKSPPLGQHKLLIITPRCALDLPHNTDHVVALDRLGAGLGEEVIICFGAPARWQHGGGHLPVEAAVLGIVDRTELTHQDTALPFAFAESAGGGR